jgi:hypothetical protein
MPAASAPVTNSEAVERRHEERDEVRRLTSRHAKKAVDRPHLLRRRLPPPQLEIRVSGIRPEVHGLNDRRPKRPALSASGPIALLQERLYDSIDL